MPWPLSEPFSEPAVDRREEVAGFGAAAALAAVVDWLITETLMGL